MSFIHKQPINTLARILVSPFKKIIPPKFFFAIDGTLKIELTEGKSMMFHANPTSNLLRVLFWKGIEGFEFKEYKIFVPLVKRSAVFLDIGANIGYYSIVAKKFNPSIIVHGFEPMPSANKYFKINAGLNNYNDIHIHSEALTNYIGEATFYSNINPRFPNIKDHLFGDNSLDEKATGNISRIQIHVKTDTLDHFVEKNLKENQKVDLMKLDTESTEYLVLQGGQNTLQKHRPIIMCEVIKDFHENEIASILNKCDYIFYEVSNSGLREVKSLFVEKGKNDYFFVPKEKRNLVQDLISKN